MWNALLAIRHFVNRSSVSSRGIAGRPQGPAGLSNRVGSSPTQPGGLLWLRERLGWFAIVFAPTESCEERDSPGIRPCGVTPAWRLSWGAGPPLGHEAAPDRAVRRPNWGQANLHNCSHARLVWIGCNKTRLLSLMFVAEVNSGTRTGSCEQVRAALRELHGRAALVQAGTDFRGGIVLMLVGVALSA